MSRILHILYSPRREGTPRLVLDWLATGTHEQGVLFLSAEPAELTPAFHAICRWVRTAAPLGRPPGKYFAMIGAARRAVREFRPDVVIVWPAGWSHWLHLGSRLAGRPRLLTHAGTAPGTSFYRRYVYTWICFGLGRICGHRVIACSKSVQADFTAIPFVSERLVRAVYNCCAVERFIRPATTGTARANRVCMVGSLEDSKDYPNLFRAWQVVEKAGDYELHIAGGGTKRAALELLAGDLGLRRVTFLGAIDDVPALLWSAKVFAFSANPEEGFGTVLIEALAAGCRVVATDVPACREVLQSGRYGTLVAPRDPAALAAAMLAQLQGADHDGTAGVDYARGFSTATMIEHYLAIAFGPPRGGPTAPPAGSN